jgi:hypothetical protein
MSNLQSEEAKLMGECVRLPASAVTITFTDSINKIPKEHQIWEAKNALRWFLIVLDNQCFGHGQRREDYKVGSVVVVEGIGKNNRIHCHLSLEIPKNFSRQEFNKKIWKSKQKVDLFGYIKIKPMFDTKWHSYMTKELNRETCWDLCRKAQQ